MALAKYLLMLLFIILVFRATDGKHQKEYFRDDYKYLNITNSFYKIHTIPKTWEDAKERCSREGAVLFFPEDDIEAGEVLAHLSKTEPTLAFVYVGISSLLAKGVFMTINGDAIRQVYNKWKPGEPNNSNGDEDCVILFKDGKFNDVGCSGKYPFICKKTLISLKWNTECNSPYLDYKYEVKLGRCYKFHLFPLSWNDALDACDAEQARLAIINTQEEADHLVNITASAAKDNVMGLDKRDAVHLGFIYDRTKYNWKTIMDETLERAGYAAWAPLQPDGGEKELCGSMSYNGYLNDIVCKARCFFICETENSLLSSSLGERFGKY